ncbi:MAG: type III secretion inner membrane ring lipoprotein SctJ [Endozoicomonadaceae bacterium]|nr:type III secretion inner membrane ring lipoprotein SctJ [Endozoicomonadaceae bacterium]MBE8232897.1 type III secretion inner membrane ring lipoprotein SctJ [Endozoicomonadaceae bacterium]
MAVYILKRMLGFLLILCLTGCESQLYTGLTEREGNEMLAMLLQYGVDAIKEINKDREVTLFVPKNDVARSITLLRSNGYPKDKFSSVGDIFPKEGLISSPVEEKARYMFSVSQELSATLSLIDGVVTARVHVVLPRESNGLDEPHPSSASVFIKYSPELILNGFIMKVKTLIANSIEGIMLDRITVTLFPSEAISNFSLGDTARIENILSIRVEHESKTRLIIIVSTLGLLILLLLIALGGISWLFFQSKKKNTSMPSLNSNINIS